MDKRKKLIFSIACGAFALLFSAIYLQIQERSLFQKGEPKKILVAVIDIKPNTIIEPGLLEVRKTPKMYVQPGSVSDPRDVVGLVTTAPVKKGEQLLLTKLVLGGTAGGLSSKIPDGMRAVSININNAGSVGGLIRPDDYVDVIVTFDQGGRDKSDKYTYTLFQNVPVLAVDTSMNSLRDPDGIVTNEKRTDGMFGALSELPASKGTSNTVTLALAPEDAEKLIFAKDAGSVALILRSTVDRAISENLSIVSKDKMVGQSGFGVNNFSNYQER